VSTDKVPVSCDGGFTLVEMLVALFIFSLIAVASVTLLRSSADAQVAVKDRLANHSAFMRSANLLEADLAQALPRPVRDTDGNLVPAFSGRLQSGQVGGTALFGFTRGGLSAGTGSGHPAVSRVAYSFNGGALVRTAWPMADGSTPMPAAELQSQLRSVAVRFRDIKGEWQPVWQPSDAGDMPRAVELTVTPVSRPPYRLVILVGSQMRGPLLPLPAAGLDPA
jgi:general secretion pathway protein J